MPLPVFRPVQLRRQESRLRPGGSGAQRRADSSGSGSTYQLGTYGRVRVEIMGSPKCGIVGKSQPVLMMINPMIFTRTRSDDRSRKI
jgi:hypothetical protein